MDVTEIIDMQAKDNIYNKNYKTEIEILIIKRKGFRKIVVPMSLRRKILTVVHENFGHVGIQKKVNFSQLQLA